ncbi:MAG: hypothetical protein GY700_15560 [Propionibacteriaceae bacterium]|nr:hypothetical protein [Propionibacteriaceae bacterium]
MKYGYGIIDELQSGISHLMEARGIASMDQLIGMALPEPVTDFIRKGGDEAETAGRECVCNALMASIDLGQTQKNGEPELPLVTSGDDVAGVARFVKPGEDTYTAADVVEYLLRDVALQG